MWAGLTYTRRTYVIWGAFVLFLILGYRFSFSDSFALAADMKEKRQKLEWLKEKQKDLPALRQKMEEFGQVYSANDSLAVRDRLTAHISDFAEQNNCLVTYIPANTFYKDENLKVQTNTFTIRGRFADLLTLLNTLETDFRYISRVMSARFYLEQDYQSKRKNLYLTVVTQTFQKQN